MDGNLLVGIGTALLGFGAQLVLSAFVYGQLTERVKAVSTSVDRLVQIVDTYNQTQQTLAEHVAQIQALSDRITRLEDQK